jgi:hypothetical protein
MLSTRICGLILIALGLWLLPLIWSLYRKYEKEKNAEKGASVPLVMYAALTSLTVAVCLFFAVKHKNKIETLQAEQLEDSVNAQ